MRSSRCPSLLQARGGLLAYSAVKTCRYRGTWGRNSPPHVSCWQKSRRSPARRPRMVPDAGTEDSQIGGSLRSLDCCHQQVRHYMKKATDLRRYEHQSVVEFRAVFEMLRRINKCAPQVRNDLLGRVAGVKDDA